jgi:dynactin-6
MSTNTQKQLTPSTTVSSTPQTVQSTQASSQEPTKPREIKTVIIIKPKAIVCQDANIVGEVTIDEGTVVHPRCNILAENGPIVIGKNNIIDEQVTIKNVEDKVLTIGNNNLIEVGAYVETLNIGSNNRIEAKAIVKAKVVGDNCVIGPKVEVGPEISLSHNTVIWGAQNHTRIQVGTKEMHLASHPKLLELLSKTLPNFHHIRK